MLNTAKLYSENGKLQSSRSMVVLYASKTDNPVVVVATDTAVLVLLVYMHFINWAPLIIIGF